VQGDHVALLSENEPAHCAALCRRLRCEMSDTLKVVADASGGNSVRKYVKISPLQRGISSLESAPCVFTLMSLSGGAGTSSRRLAACGRR